jgi:prepilin peptidase CpaA
MHSFAWWPTLFALSIATFTDLRWRRIPNWLVVPYLASGLIVSCCMNGWRGLELSMAGLLIGGLSFGILFLMGGMGAGDVKLCAAIGAWVGPSQMLLALVGAGLAGGVMVLVWAAHAGLLAELFRSTGQLAMNRNSAAIANYEEPPMRRTMPYGPAIAIGALLSFFAHA